MVMALAHVHGSNRSFAPLAKVDMLDGVVLARLRHELRGAVARNCPGREALAAGVARHLASVSTSVRRLVASSAEELSARGTFDRPIVQAALHCAHLLGEQGQAITSRALESATAPWSAFVAAAQVSWTGASAVREALARLQTRAQGHLAFGAAFVRAMAGDVVGARATERAVMLNEANRVRWFEEFALPLLARGVLPAGGVVGTLEALRRAERHLGRWLRMGELELACGGGAALDDCRLARATAPSQSANVWEWMGWALSPRDAAPTRITRDVVNKLSDRSSTRRDLSFLHRVGASGVEAAAASLAAAARASKTPDAVRALLTLISRYGRADRVASLRDLATRGSEDIRGIACAALWDVGDRTAALELVDELVISKNLANVGWGALIRVAHLTGDAHPVVTDASVRRLCEGRVY